MAVAVPDHGVHGGVAVGGVVEDAGEREAVGHLGFLPSRESERDDVSFPAPHGLRVGDAAADILGDLDASVLHVHVHTQGLEKLMGALG